MSCSLLRFVLRSATPRESMNGPLELCHAQPSSQLVELSGSGIICFKENPLSHRKREFVNVTGEPHTSQEKKTELQTTCHWKLRQLHNPRGHLPSESPGDQVPAIVQLREYCPAASCGAVWSMASCSTFLLPFLSVDQPLCLSFLGHQGPVENVRVETSGPEPRAFQWVFPSVHALLSQI